MPHGNHMLSGRGIGLESLLLLCRGDSPAVRFEGTQNFVRGHESVSRRDLFSGCGCEDCRAGFGEGGGIETDEAVAHCADILASWGKVASEIYRKSFGTGFAFGIDVSLCISRGYGGGGRRPPPRHKPFVFKRLGK